MFAGGGIGTTTTDKKKMLRRQLGSGLLIAALAGAVILMNHFFFLREQGFSKNLTGVLVTRLMGDDPLNSLQGALVEKLMRNYKKKRRGSRLKCMRAATSSTRMTVSRQRTNAPGLLGSGSMQRLSSGDEKAIVDYDEVIRLDPKDVYAYIYRGCAYERKGDYDKAIADYDEAIRLDPKGAKAYEIRGAAYHDKGDYDKAIADYDEAIRLDPKYALPYNSFAWLLGTCPQVSFRDGKKAINYAIKAWELSKDPAFLDTLAAAYAEAGDFKQAIKWETKFLETPNLSEKNTTGGKSRLALYQAHKPYHAEKGPTSTY